MSDQNSKKRKRNVVLHQESQDSIPDTTKPTAVFKPSKGRAYTVSIALPGSIIANAQTHELQTILAGTIARAAAVFCVDEIVVYNDGHTHASPNPSNASKRPRSYNAHTEDASPEHKHTGFTDPNHFLATVLSYLECPAHLRKALMPFHQNFRYAGALPSLDMPHHMKADEWCQYREGVTLSPTADSSSSSAEEQHTTLIHTGLPTPTPLSIHPPIPPNTRVTLKYASATPPPSLAHPQSAIPVSPAAPREEGGYYWGYSVRSAPSLSAVFTEAEWEGGYDVSIGTSERGASVTSILPTGSENSSVSQEGRLPPSFKHLLLVFGGVAGLEVAAAFDTELKSSGVTGANVSSLFDAWVNLVPGQGSRTMRTEEAVWVGLTATREYVLSAGR
ncbi:DUF171-domain-containing protein [Pseudovirgaria hyperparasitica]|uniref:DUF171-domain-containing protein n=1 Tax=Pseudovirgaria hyperparasitica TaxID=470096 RepID=A0A6A6W4K2_9PEZI|nr:DUF171-domain-containing protein [Pseudovirgaria hyperparasitica]KAF2757543.1 DUF171-domain-containing protein [Pseudovirgaria hyperparasitica]